MLDEILTKVGLKYEELTLDERETLHSWIGAIEKTSISPQKLREYISQMKNAVSLELSDSKLGSKHDMYLKARLRNYILFEAFLSTPEKAQEALNRAISGIVSNKK